MSLASFPANKNFLSPLGFRLVFDRLPTVEYFCQGATLPSVSINNIEIPNPILPLNVPSTKLNTGDFSVVFRVDEDLANYNELYQLMIDLTFDRQTSLYLHMGESRLKKFQTNPNGGDVALGHPIGATGSILTIKAIYELHRCGGRYALVTMCIGGGQGVAAVFERL